MESLDTYTHLPLHLDPTSKAISAPSTTTSDPSLATELHTLNTLHRSLLTLDTGNHTPPPPLPVNPKRSAQITKLRDSANASFRKGTFAEAIKLYTYGIEMASTRPPWEPVGLVRDELAGLYANRAQAYMAMQDWVGGWKDAECSVECKKVGNAKAWWRGGRCLCEMGRWEEAGSWVEKGLEVEGTQNEGHKELVGLMTEVKRGAKREGRGKD